MKKLALALVLALSSFTTSPISRSPEITRQELSPPYRLEELLDTSINRREIKIEVYIQPSERLKEYHEHSVFNYVKEFFLKQDINCKFSYTKRPLKEKIAPDELGLEIYDSQDNLVERICELKDLDPRKQFIIPLIRLKGFAVTKRGIALVNGGWEIEKENKIDTKDSAIFDQKSVSSILKIYDVNMTPEEVYMKWNAALISHEICHVLALEHTPSRSDFYPTKEIPNLMVMDEINPNFVNDGFGYKLTEEQKKIIHSYISGGNVYKAFNQSDRNLEIFWKKVKR